MYDLPTGLNDRRFSTRHVFLPDQNPVPRSWFRSGLRTGKSWRRSTPTGHPGTCGPVIGCRQGTPVAALLAEVHQQAARSPL